MDNALAFAPILGFAAVVFFAPFVIPLLEHLRFGQSVRKDGPDRHREKEGTPTMGGLLFLLALTLAVVVLVHGRMVDAMEAYLLLAVTWAYGLIGFTDDYVQVARRRSLGLRARTKLLFQVLAGGALAWVFLEWGGSTSLALPFIDGVIVLQRWEYVAFATLAVVATANAVNMTDGLDGLAAGASAIAFVTYGVVAVWMGATALGVFAFALAGACLGFLVFNFHPAKLFMGDTGSLALGAALAGLAVLTKTELWLPIIGGLFVIEAASVIIQVFAFRVFGRRVFRMSPLHHHFELAGWSEQRVVTRFWLFAAICAAVGLVGLV